MAQNQEMEVKEGLRTALGELGLLESEVNLYLTSLSLGPTSIASLAEHLAIPRPNVYKAIAGLEERGLARFAEKKRYARTFVVEPPTVLLELLRKRREIMAGLDQTLVGAMPDLLAKYHQGETLTKIKIFRGQEQFVSIFFQVLDEEKESIKYCGALDALISFIGWKNENKWIKKRKERGIRSKCLFTPSSETQTLIETDAEELRTTKVLSRISPFAASFMLYANKVMILQPKGQLIVLIEDEYITEMLSNIFDGLWELEQG